MINIDFSSICKEDEGVKQQLSKLANMQVKTQIDSAFRYSYHIDDGDYRHLQSLFKPKLVFQKLDGRLNDSSHPILAILNEYSNYEANIIASRWVENGFSVMTIGDSVNNKIKSHHNCMLLNNSRDLFRVANNSKDNLVSNHVAGRISSTPVCGIGTTECNFKADKCIAVHSLYDLSLDEIYDIFLMHDIDTLVSFMYFPIGLFHRDLRSSDSDIFRISYNKNNVVFTLNDFSTPYTHSFERWRAKAIYGKIEGKEFDVVCEHSRTIGPLHIMNYQRVRKGNFGVPVTIPLGTLFDQYYRVPDLVAAANSNFCYRQFDERCIHHIVPRHIVESILGYAMRAKDEGYKYVEIAAVASGLKHQIIIGNQVYRKSWNINHNDYKNVVISLFILGAIDRTTRTKTISACFNELKMLARDGWFTTAIHDAFKCFYRHFGDDLANLYYPKDGNNLPGYNIDRWKVLCFEDQVYDLTHNYCGDKYSKAMHFIKNKEVDDAYIEALITEDPKPTEQQIKQIDGSVDIFYTPKTSPVIAPVVVPRVFANGHCAVKSFWEGLPREDRPRQSLLLKALCDEFLNRGHDRSIVIDYICNGNWKNDLSALAIPTLADMYNKSVKVVDETGNVVIHVEKHDSDVINILYSNLHYSNLKSSRGGKLTKFDSIIDKMLPYLENCVSLHDVSAAPGYFVNRFLDKSLEADLPIKIYASCYCGKNATPFTGNKDSIVIQKYTDTYYNNFPNKKFDILVCDAARDVNTEGLTKDFIRYAKKRLNFGGIVLVKTFADPHYVYDFCTYFDKYETFNGVGTERFFLLIDFKDQQIHSFYDIYDKNHISLTSHNLMVEADKLESFRKGFFSGMDIYRPDCPIKRKIVPVKAYTGFASAAKTTGISKIFKNNIVFISPTKELSLRHNNLGFISYTQHSIFKAKLPEDATIVLDELSQFCVEYVVLLANVHSNEIVLCGDVYQTQFTNYFDMTNYTSFMDVGIDNNIIDVYKIPQDITESLNSRFGWHIRTKSDVVKSIYRLSTNIPLEKVGKQVICYNNNTAKELASRGIKCSTITTYTGSRCDDVVLYIDSAAIVSKFINNTTSSYTAVTRATNRLFLYGACDGVEKFYNFDTTMINTYEEFSQLYSHSEIFAEEVVDIPLVAQEDHVVSDYSSKELAEEIITNCYQPSGDISSFSHILPSSISSVEDGLLKTNEDAITPDVKETEVFRVSSVEAVINQVSDSSLATIRTLVKRYARGYSNHSKVDREFCFSSLVNGLHKAIYGSSFTTLVHDMSPSREHLLKNAFAYYESLSNKLGDQCMTSEEINSLFDLEKDGRLSFFNKKQTKWSPKNNFENSDKVGQGVAAFSKKVNIVFAAYARTMLDLVKKALVKNNRKILLATHDSEAGCNDSYLSLISGTKYHNYTCNDFSEWDSSFRKPFISLTSWLLSLMGMPQHVIKWFQMNRENWEMIYRNAFGSTTLKGHEKQFSGNPFTICENTIGNMALCFALFDYRDFQYGLFKGDDSAVCCRTCILKPEARKILNYTTHGLKLHNSPIGEFAGWFLTNSGLFPDVLRYAAKFLSKNYRDEEHYLEALSSLQERCSAVKSMKQLNEGCIIVSQYYTQQATINPISDVQICLLFNFLKKSRFIPFSNLGAVKKRVCII